LAGSPVSALAPLLFGPRHCGQSLAIVAVIAFSDQIRAATEISFFILVSRKTQAFKPQIAGQFSKTKKSQLRIKNDHDVHCWKLEFIVLFDISSFGISF
jgi:hypothetical protein